MPKFRVRVGITVYVVGVVLAGFLAVAGLALLVMGSFDSVPLLPVSFVLGLILAGTAGAAFVVSWRVSGSIGDAVSVMNRMAEGHLDQRLTAKSPLREVDAFSRSFNSMASKIQESTRRLVHQAFHDPLTGLPNRALFMSRFSTAMASSSRPGHVAVLFIDVDRFKVLNDTLGHGVGDSLLTVLSDRLVAASGRDSIVARLGGDEFTVLIQSPSAEARALEVAERITRNVRRPFSVAGHELFVTASVGIAVSSPEDHAITELLRKADIALYRAKSEGKDRYALFHPSLDEVSVERVDLDSALRRAVERKQLLLHYQPEVDLRTGTIVGMEALLRWNHPHRGILSPAEFIAMAEETGEIVNIGQWVLEEACRQTVAFANRVPQARHLVVGVNISASEFRQQDLVARVAGVLAETGLEPSRLKIELTESMLMENIPVALVTLAELKSLGVRLAIDDFGIGYSSLSYIQRLPVDTLKVDQSFVGAIEHDPRTAAIVTAVVELGDALDMEVTAEGIESPGQVEFLQRAGCHRGQGHYFSKAMPKNSFEQMLRESSLRGGVLFEVA